MRWSSIPGQYSGVFLLEAVFWGRLSGWNILVGRSSLVICSRGGGSRRQFSRRVFNEPILENDLEVAKIFHQTLWSHCWKEIISTNIFLESDLKDQVLDSNRKCWKHDRYKLQRILWLRWRTFLYQCIREKLSQEIYILLMLKLLLIFN